MKTLYLIGSVLLTSVIIAVALLNTGSACNSLDLYFYEIESNPALIFLCMAVVGMLTGALYHAFIVRILDDTNQQELPPR